MNIDQIKILLKEQYGITGSISPLQGEVDLNFNIQNEQKEYILKIASPDTLYASLTFQHALLAHLKKHITSIDIPSIIHSKSGQDIVTLNFLGEERYVRVLDWIPGRVWAKVNPHSLSLLESLGKTCGEISKALVYFDHPGAHRYIKWDPAQISWVEPHLNIFPTKEKIDLAHVIYQVFLEHGLPYLNDLRQSVNHNDANDYNVLVSNSIDDPKVIGLVDYGDAVYTYTINELAIAIAYAIMHKKDPLSAATAVVKGYQQIFTLQENDIKVLWAMVCARLLISVTASAINNLEHPDNEYLQISNLPAWTLLKRIKEIPYEFAHYAFRQACGWESCTQWVHFNNWAKDQHMSWQDIVHTSHDMHHLDLSIGSKNLGHFQNYEDGDKFHHLMSQYFTGGNRITYAGGYGEMRPFYTSDAYERQGNNGPEWRTVHLGIDIWLPPQTPIFAPFTGIVHSIQDNEGPRNYGPTLILTHEIHPDLVFYTLYGHLERNILDKWNPGDQVNEGDILGGIGYRDENGEWPPHLHFQIILDMMDHEGDFPGVCYPDESHIWKSICPDPSLLFGEIQGTVNLIKAEDILEVRKKRLGKNLSISYNKPLHMVRGNMQYLQDITGRKYLDMVNNVAHVGHEHPGVVKAARQQIALLNTNTRYLHEELVAYTEELAATLPDPLEVCFFVNSGSEANELALRMAKTFTGQKDIIALKIGYHGNTGATIDVSSYKFDGKGGSGEPMYTHITPMPDIFRGMFDDSSLAGKQYAHYIKNAIDRLETKGRGVAGFICESIMSCGGQIVLPEEYLLHAYQYVREAGGVCIADEVQVGFGRVGEKFWGFELQEVVPDIVTMGKPIANGHPMGAVVTTREIADAFANGMEYFNTFGGNPVSCAIGREVLHIIKEESLQHHALEIGTHLKHELIQLKRSFPIIGDVRGHGLFVGIELVNENKGLLPLPHQAAYLANRMRDFGILMSTDGPDHNVLKIKPPMCISKSNIDMMLDTMNDILMEDVMQNY